MESQNIERLLRRTALLAKVPSWFDKQSCVLSECGKPDKRTVNVTFNCNCKGGKRTTQPVYVGARTCTVSMGERIVEVLHDKHARHWHTHEAPEPEDPGAVAAAEVVRLKNAVIAGKRKASVLSKALNGAEKKVKAAAPVMAAAKESQRLSTKGSKRRREIDSACTDKFDRANKSTAMTAADTGAELTSARRLRVGDVLSSVNVAVVSPLLLLQSLVPAIPPVSMHCTHQCR
jgi:hypothetical protein